MGGTSEFDRCCRSSRKLSGSENLAKISLLSRRSWDRRNRGSAARSARPAARPGLADRFHSAPVRKFYDTMFSGLWEFGYFEGQNLIVERRYAEANAERLKEFAAEAECRCHHRGDDASRNGRAGSRWDWSKLLV
jgi:hypothetical protein